MIIENILNVETLVIFLAILLGCFVKGAIGFGLPLIATPIMLFLIPIPEIIAILALPIMIANLQQIWLNRTQWRVLKKFWPLITASTLIMSVGAPIMVRLDSYLLGILIGLLISIHAVLSSFPLPHLQRWSLTTETMQRMIVPAGVISGILGSFTSIYSFPSLQLMMLMKVRKDDFALLLGVFLSLGFAALWFGIANADFPVSDYFILSGMMMIPAVVGQQAGHMARHHISEPAFRKIVHFALACAGMTLIIRGLLNII